MLTVQSVLAAVADRQRGLQPSDLLTRLDRFKFVLPRDGHGKLVPARGSGPDLELTELSRNQLLARLGIPAAYYDRCPPRLQREHVRWFMGQDEATRPVRLRIVRGNIVRAILTDSYTPLDDVEVVPAFAEALCDVEVKVVSFSQDDDYTHLRIVFPRTEREVRPGDLVQVGLHLSNSEVGLRAVRVDSLLFRLVCSNGAVRRERTGQAYRHVGKPDRLREAVVAAIAEAREGAERLSKSFKDSADVELVTARPIIDGKTRTAGLTRGQAAAIEAEFNAAGDRTLFGLVNAFTRAAQREGSAEARFRMERAGTELLGVAG